MEGDSKPIDQSSSTIQNVNMNNNEQSTITAQTSQWAKRKDFLKLTNQCHNKEKINYAIEKLIA